MNPSKDEATFECCCGQPSKKSLIFGIAVLVVGLMLQNQYTIPDILIVIGGILVVKSLLMMVVKKDN